MQRFRILIYLSVIILTVLSCSTNTVNISNKTFENNAYDSHFPHRDCSEAIDKIMQSVTRVICMTYYTSYTFPDSMDLRLQDITDTTINRYGDEYHFTDNVTGTAIVLYYDTQKALLLSASHIFHKPDTIFTHIRKPERPFIKLISGIAIKDRQKNIAAEFYDSRDLKILYEDRENDLVLLETRFAQTPEANIIPVEIPFGKSHRLSWGSFIYLMGYPKGVKAISHGIVAQPWDKYKNRFIIDAPFNRGMSGGLVMAINNGVPNFEIVGVASSAYSEEESYLVPDMLWEYDPGLPYKGPIYVQNKKSINYGVSIISPSESVVKLLQRYRLELEEKGYDLNKILEK